MKKKEQKEGEEGVVEAHWRLQYQES